MLMTRSVLSTFNCLLSIYTYFVPPVRQLLRRRRQSHQGNENMLLLNTNWRLRVWRNMNLREAAWSSGLGRWI